MISPFLLAMRKTYLIAKSNANKRYTSWCGIG